MILDYGTYQRRTAGKQQITRQDVIVDPSQIELDQEIEHH